MESIEQRIFSEPSPFPRKINVKHFSMHQADEAVKYLLEDQVLSTSSLLPIGVACHSAKKGGIDFMVLSTTTTAVLIVVEKQKPRNPGGSISTLLSAGEIVVNRTPSKACLVGFSIACSAIQITQATNLQVQGVDIGRFSSSVQHAPVNIVVDETKPLSVNKWMVCRLWMGSDRSSKRDTCLQSWLAAWYVHVSPTFFLAVLRVLSLSQQCRSTGSN